MGASARPTPRNGSGTTLGWVGAGALIVAAAVVGWRMWSAPSYPARLVERTALPGTGDAVRAPRIAQHDGYVLVCDEELGFGVWDVRDPASPSRVHMDGWEPHELDDLKRDGDRLLVDQRRGPTVLDISSPAEPRVLSRVPGRDIAVVGDRVYAAKGSQIVSARLDGDDRRPLEPELPYAELARVGDAHLLAVSHEETDDDTNVLVWSVRDASAPELVHQSTLGSVVEDVVVMDGTAYVATTDDGVVVFDVSDPRRPTQVTQVPELVAYYVYADPEHDRLLVLHEDNAVHVLDISDPRHPRLLAKHEARATGATAAPDGHVVIGSRDGVHLLAPESAR